MRVVELKKPGGLANVVVAKRPEPEPAAGEILVRWHASSLNNHDRLVAVGGLPTEDGRILMSDGAGEVVALGPGATRWQVGDKVMSLFFPDWQVGPATSENILRIPGDRIDGFAAEFSALPETAVTRIPEGYSYAEAATLPCAPLTAWRALVAEGGIQPGDSVLVQGTGGFSIFALQLARASGARVYATTSSEAKAEKLRALGAHAVVNYREDPKWGETVRDLSGGGVEHVLDVGGAGTLAQSLLASCIGGRVTCIGALDGREASIFLPALFFKQQKIQCISVGSAAMQYDMVDAIEASGLRPVIDEKAFSLDSLADAFRYEESNAHFGKIVVEY